LKSVLRQLSLIIISVILLSAISTGCSKKKETVFPKMEIQGFSTKLIFIENFDTDLSNWVIQGKGNGDITGTGALRLTGATKSQGVVMWLNREISGDFLLEFETTVNDSSGLCAVIICAQYPGGKDLLNDLPEPSGNLMLYTKKLRSYIIDYHNRSKSTGTAGASKVRKNPGYMLLASVDTDPCSESRPYYIDIVKIGNRMQLYVEGKRIQDIRDKGGFGPAYMRGYIGFWVHGISDQYNIALDNIRIFQLNPE